MFPRPQALLYLQGMKHMRGSNIHQIHGRVGQHLIVRTVGFIKTILVRQLLGPGQIPGRYRITVDNVGFLHSLPHSLRNTSRSQNSKIIFHTTTSLFHLLVKSAQTLYFASIITRTRACASKIQIAGFRSQASIPDTPLYLAGSGPLQTYSLFWYNQTQPVSGWPQARMKRSYLLLQQK